MGKLFGLLWGALILLQLTGGITRYYFIALLLITGIFLALSRDRWEIYSRSLDWVEERVSANWVTLYAAYASFAIVSACVLYYEVFDTPLWDLGIYLQGIYHQSVSGTPWVGFGDQVGDATNLHWSLSIFVLGFLYRIFQHPWVVLIWQCLFLVAPAWVGLLGYLAVVRRTQHLPSVVGALLTFWIYVYHPTFAGQMGWAYVFHIAGPFFFALAYYFWFLEKWWLWVFAVILFSLQKEEFAIYSACFAGVVFLEELFRFKSKKKKPLFLSLGLGIAVVVIYHLMMNRSGVLIRFEDRFGNLGATPMAALKNFIMGPSLYFSYLKRAPALSYLFFFLGCSLIWLKPRWKVVRYFFPVLPILLLQCGSYYSGMILLKDHYALPILVGLHATLIYGVFGSYAEGNLRSLRKGYLALFLVMAIYLGWGTGEVFKPMVTTYQTYLKRSEERQIIKKIQADKELIVCCEDRLCTSIADRPVFLRWEFCVQGSQLLKQHSGKRAVYLIYSNKVRPEDSTVREGVKIPLPEKWETVTPFFQLSPVARVP